MFALVLVSLPSFRDFILHFSSSRLSFKLVCDCSCMNPLILSQQRTLLQTARPSTAFQFLARTNGSKEYPLLSVVVYLLCVSGLTVYYE